NIDIINFILLRMIPTIILNVILLIILFPVFIKFMKKTHIQD
ncbi:rod shape-determining protein MreD, partial [Staphylococcus haemolyticus]